MTIMLVGESEADELGRISHVGPSNVQQTIQEELSSFTTLVVGAATGTQIPFSGDAMSLTQILVSLGEKMERAKLMDAISTLTVVTSQNQGIVFQAEVRYGSMGKREEITDNSFGSNESLAKFQVKAVYIPQIWKGTSLNEPNFTLLFNHNMWTKYYSVK